MRTTRVAGFVLVVGVVLWGEAFAQAPGVPLAATEANDSDDSFGDGPTPFPRPSPPKPTPLPVGVAAPETLTGAEAIYAYAKGVTWFTRKPDGRLVWHDCGDTGRITAQLADAPQDRIAAVLEMASGQSAALMTALSPWRTAYVATVLHDTPAGEVNSAWWAYVGEHAEEIAVGLAWVTAEEVFPAGECTTGRCDCCTSEACCPYGATGCDCQTYDSGRGDCFTTRMTCNVVEQPEPKRGARTVGVRWQY